MLNTRWRDADRSKRYVASASHRAAHLDSRPSKAGLEGISGDTGMAESETRTLFCQRSAFGPSVRRGLDAFDLLPHHPLGRVVDDLADRAVAQEHAAHDVFDGVLTETGWRVAGG